MQKSLEQTNSYRREDTEDKYTKEKMAEGGYRPDENTADKNNANESAADKNTANEKTAGTDHAGEKTFSIGDAREDSNPYSPAAHVRDANSRTIFRSRKLTCQFLRDYSGLSSMALMRKMRFLQQNNLGQINKKRRKGNAGGRPADRIENVVMHAVKRGGNFVYFSYFFILWILYFFNDRYIFWTYLSFILKLRYLKG